MGEIDGFEMKNVTKELLLAIENLVGEVKYYVSTGFF
jgi:hypothetical protein